jgi:hypothetical protein
MSTIPTIFNKTIPSYTALGGAERGGSSGLSAVLLNRSGRYPRRTLFKELEKTGFDTIISIEGPHERYDLEDLSQRFPFVRFILLKENVSPGEQINLAVCELSSPLFFVLWNDLRPFRGAVAGKIAAWLREEEDGEKIEFRRLCTVPVIQNSQFEMLPTLIFPTFFRGALKTFPCIPLREGLPSLYPFDGVGIYDRDRFIKLGGFDGTLKNPHWQLMDFGFRAHLWGEEISCTQMVRLSYDGEAAAEDTTAEESYRRFYLKNLAPVFRGDFSYLPLRRFPSYLIRTGGDPFAAWEDFAESRRWVKVNRYRFRGDARSLTDLWPHPEEQRRERSGFPQGST